MNLTRADLPDHLGRWVTVANPDPHLATAATWYGRLVALADDPTVVIQAPGGGQGVFPQAFTITPADPPEPGTISPRRQAAYDAVYAVIRRLGPELPPDPVHRNAMIWHAVTAALDAANIPVPADPDDPIPTSSSSPAPPGDTVPNLGDTGDQTSPASGGHAHLPVPLDDRGHTLTSSVPARPHPEDTGDTSGDMSGDGVRFAYRATVRRGQVRHAIAEAFDLLGAELAHPQHPEEEGRRDA
ncbi:hypothetical protein [Streptomyces sp. NPDC006355]|uniref:hypothetical protein n=1 Tax=Streptomyces sp. NPDC006355 TaxID=3156758 RepID=UPI0033BB4A72